MPPKGRKPKSKSNNRTVAAINMPNLSPQTPTSSSPTSNIVSYNNNNTANAQTHIPVINIQNFNGNTPVNYFINQVTELAEINKWDNKLTLLYAKSKLEGKAQTLINQAEEIKRFSSPEELFNKLKNNFKEKSLAENLNEFNNFQMLPDESITNLAHRLDLITHRVYGEDTISMDKTKFLKFVQLIPPEMRQNILENKIETYQEAVDKAQLIQDCRKNTNILNHNKEEEKFSNITHQINSLQQSIEKIQTDKQSNTNIKSRGKFNKFNKQNFHSKRRGNIGKVKNNYNRDWNTNTAFKRNFRGRNFNNNYNSNNRQNIRCQLCLEWGHTARQCSQLQVPSQENVTNTNNFPAIPYHTSNHPNF